MSKYQKLKAAALGLCVILCAVASAAAVQTPPPTPVQVEGEKPSPQQQQQPPPMGQSPLAPSHKQQTPGEAKVESAKSFALEVHEIDETELVKLLARDPAQASTPSRPLLVNFWATWCDPCREEFPDLVKIDKQYRPLGLDFILVSLDDVSDINMGVPQFIQKMDATGIPAYLLNARDTETAISVIDKEWRGELPATFLFDRQGKIVYKRMGRIKPAELRKAIEAVTGDKLTISK